VNRAPAFRKKRLFGCLQIFFARKYFLQRRTACGQTRMEAGRKKFLHPL
jgi:hypothetical protein